MHVIRLNLNLNHGSKNLRYMSMIYTYLSSVDLVEHVVKILVGVEGLPVLKMLKSESKTKKKNGKQEKKKKKKLTEVAIPPYAKPEVERSLMNLDHACITRERHGIDKKPNSRVSR